MSTSAYTSYPSPHKITTNRGLGLGLGLDAFVHHFENLVGVSEAKIPEECKKKMAWKIAEEWLGDKSRYEKEWEMETGPPSWEEMKKAASMGKPGKMVNRSEIPSELWRNSESSLRVLWKLMRVVWVRMSEDLENDQLPEDWIDATLVCLYKGKGSRQDPGMYRGISLISSMEKIFTTVILNRIQKWVDKVIKQQQSGFRPNQSTRNAVFGLWRDMERKWRSKEGFIVTFIDFSKAFDSLVWEMLWKIMECLGCPEKMVTVVRSLYSQSTISIRLSKEGDLAPAFKQKKGTRQGSGLSPCIFTLPVDFAMKVADMACEEMGLVNDEDKRGAYADDVAERTRNEEEASISLQEFEAAAAITGLGVNVAKTEAMGCRIKKAITSEEAENAMKEWVQVKGHGIDAKGWMAPAKWRAELGIQQWKDEEVKGKMAIKLSEGDTREEEEEEWLVEVRGGGWILECKSGRKFRMTKLGCLRSLSAKKVKEKKEKKKGEVCDECGEEFPSKVSLHKHIEGGWCKKMKDMSEKELSRRRVTRDTAAKKRGERRFDVEPVEVRSCNGGVAKQCGSYVYLGTLTIAKGSSGPEIRRRIRKARAAFIEGWNMWKMKGLSKRLKGKLYSAFVHSVLLYNCEVWVIGKGEMEALEAKNVYLMRKVIDSNVRNAEERLSRQQLLEMLGLESIEVMIRRKRLRWVAHCARRGEEDLTWRRMKRELEDDGSGWGRQVREDWKRLGVRSVEEWHSKVQDRKWLSLRMGKRRQAK